MPLRLSGLPAMIVPLTPERVLLQASNPPSASCGRSSRLRAAAFQGLQIIGAQSVIYRATVRPPLGLRIRWAEEKKASLNEEKLAKIAPAHCRL